MRAEERGIAQSALADAADIKRSAMTNYWSGKRPYPLGSIVPLAKKLSTSVKWLLSGDTTSDDDDDIDFVAVQEVDLAYGLGSSFADEPVELQTHLFPRAWLEAITTSPPAMLTFARGRGDSMQPTVQDGDMVLIDRSQRTIREQDAIWALTIGQFAMIKRIRARGERVTILSDNDRVPPDEVHHEEINVVGRVIFIGRRV